MLLLLARILLFVIILSPWIALVWWVVRRRKSIFGFIRRRKLLSLMLAPVAGIGLLGFYTVWAICVVVFGSILNSALERMIPHEPPAWVGSGLDEVFNMNEGVEVLAGGDPAWHQYNEKICDYLIHITDPAKLAYFEKYLARIMPIEERSAHPLTDLPYLGSYADKFPTTHRLQFREFSANAEYNLTVYVGVDGYYYLSVWRIPVL